MPPSPRGRHRTVPRFTPQQNCFAMPRRMFTSSRSSPERANSRRTRDISFFGLAGSRKSSATSALSRCAYMPSISSLDALALATLKLPTRPAAAVLGTATPGATRTPAPAPPAPDSASYTPDWPECARARCSARRPRSTGRCARCRTRSAISPCRTNSCARPAAARGGSCGGPYSRRRAVSATDQCTPASASASVSTTTARRQHVVGAARHRDGFRLVLDVRRRAARRARGARSPSSSARGPPRRRCRDGSARRARSAST